MATQRHELEAFLGDGSLYTAEQQDQIIEEFQAWEGELGGAADQDESSSMLTSIAQRVAGDLDLDQLVAEDREAQRAAAEARGELRSAVVALVRARDLSESEAARRAGVDRMTVRAWLGK